MVKQSYSPDKTEIDGSSPGGGTKYRNLSLQGLFPLSQQLFYRGRYMMLQIGIVLLVIIIAVGAL